MLSPSELKLTPLGNTLIVASLCTIIGLNLPVLPVFDIAQHYAILHLWLEAIAIFTLLLIGLATLLARQPERRLPVFGAACLAIAILDAAHTLSYQGMPDFFGPSDPEKAISLWLVARALTAATILALALSRPRPVSLEASLGLLVVGVSAGIALAFGALNSQDHLPRTFIAGEGLTPFKVNTEIAIAIAFALASALLYRRFLRPVFRAAIDYRMLAAAAWMFGLTEVFFATYQEVTDAQNFLGHLYKIIGSGMLAWAILRGGREKRFR